MLLLWLLLPPLLVLLGEWEGPLPFHGRRCSLLV